jgi:branched-chain amino acid transport system ATP-binding protein
VSDALSQPMESSAAAGGAEQHDTPLLQLVSVTKRFGGLAAVADLSFLLQKGEILGMIGPNGAGKSTMVNVIGGSMTPTSGTILYRGHDITRLPTGCATR